MVTTPCRYCGADICGCAKAIYDDIQEIEEQRRAAIEEDLDIYGDSQ